MEYLAFPETKTINDDNTYHTTGIASGKDGMLWIATYSGVFGYDGKSFTTLNETATSLRREPSNTYLQSRKIALGIFGLATEIQELGNLMERLLQTIL